MILDLAREYFDRGWCVVPLPRGQKRPVIDRWQELRLTREQLPTDGNLGVNLGEPSGGLADVDLDCDEAVELAPRFVPPTLTFGRASKPRSHWLFIAGGAVTEKFDVADLVDPRKRHTIVELRGTPAGNVGRGVGGSQTVMPGSQHPSGELVEWSADDDANEPRAIASDELRRRVVSLAVTALVQRHAGREAALAFLDGKLPPLPAPIAARVREWLGVTEQRAPKPRPRARGPAPAWLDRLRARAIPELAQLLGLGVGPGRSLGPCPYCQNAKRGSHEKRFPIGVRADGLGWRCHACGAHGDTVTLAAIVLVKTARPRGEDWRELQRLVEANGL